MPSKEVKMGDVFKLPLKVILSGYDWCLETTDDEGHGLFLSGFVRQETAEAICHAVNEYDTREARLHRALELLGRVIKISEISDEEWDKLMLEDIPAYLSESNDKGGENESQGS